MIEVTDDEVYSSAEFAQYQLILDDHAAYYYAREELIAAKQRAAETALVYPTQKAWYTAYLASPEWQARAVAAKVRAGGRCMLCNSTGPLDTHHRTYERVGDELPEDLVALCRDCHDGYHRWRRSHS
jgi:hypothetical protein